MLQKNVFINQSAGVEGGLVDDSPRRATGKFLYGNKSQTVAAEGFFYFDGNVSDGETFTIGASTYTFKTTPSAANDLFIGLNQYDSMNNLIAAINGTGTAGTNYYAGTTAVANAGAALSENNTVAIVASTAGTAGNSIALGTTAVDVVASGTTLSGGATGVDVSARLARAYTYIAGSETDVQIGGAGSFAGIALNDGTVALQGGLDATLNVVDGTVASVMTFGRVWVVSSTNSDMNYVAGFNPVDGSLAAAASSAGLPDGYTEIPNATFQSVGTAGALVCLQLG